MKQASYNNDENLRYRTYHLTCWQERDILAGTVIWRFKLETPDSSQRRLFPNLKALVNTLYQETGQDQVGQK